MDEAATTLHPCWEAYRLADRYLKLVQYMAGKSVVFIEVYRCFKLDRFDLQEGSCCLFEFIFW